MARLAPQSEAERAAIRAAGLNLNEIFTCDDLVHGDAVFFAATGITSGVLLNGVRYHGDEAETEFCCCAAKPTPGGLSVHFIIYPWIF